MNLKQLVKSFIKSAFEKYYGGYIKKVKENILNNEKYVAIDVGAANGIQSWWYEVLEFATIYAYEPNKKSSKQLKEMYKGYDYNVIEEGLDVSSSEKTIYLTNVPTGSSLLKPNILYQYTDPSYMSPYKEDSIMTYSAQESFINNHIEDIDLMKIDTQGTELNILKGLGNNYTNKLLAVEFEAGLPGGYEEQPTFLEVHEYMVKNNFELFDLRSSRSNMFFKKKPPYQKEHKVSKKIHEVDVLYFKSLEYILKNNDSAKLRKLIMSYCVYNFFDEALFAIAEAERQKIWTENESKLIYDAVVEWHDAKSVFFGSYLWFNYSE